MWNTLPGGWKVQTKRGLKVEFLPRTKVGTVVQTAIYCFIIILCSDILLLSLQNEYPTVPTNKEGLRCIPTIHSAPRGMDVPSFILRVRTMGRVRVTVQFDYALSCDYIIKKVYVGAD